MKSIEKFYDVNMGSYCGLLIREDKAKKLSKLIYKQNQEIKELLASDMSDIEVSDWTLAYPEGEQTIVRYYTPSSNEEKMDRINLINKGRIMNYCKNGVFLAESMHDAESNYMKWYENTGVK